MPVLESSYVPPLQSWITVSASIIVAVAVVEAARRVLRSQIASRWPLAAKIVERCSKPAYAVAFLAGGLIGLQLARFRELEAPLQHAMVLGLTAATLWLLVQSSYVGTDMWLDDLAKLGDPDDPEYRRVRTQVLLLRRVAAAVAVVIAIGVVLFSFQSVRAVGAGLLASAGLAGIVAGVAARSTIGNMLAGLQLAFSDALRIGDIVVVEDRWGYIDEITLTYVVVRVWTGPRMILPVSYFTENPFEHWSRYRHEFLGTVYLQVDWTVPIAEIRQELYRFVHESPLWDRKDCVLNVTDVLSNGAVELRVLLSAGDWASLWDLQCDVREHLVTWLRDNHPHALPRLRAEVLSPFEAAGDGAQQRHAEQ